MIYYFSQPFTSNSKHRTTCGFFLKTSLLFGVCTRRANFHYRSSIPSCVSSAMSEDNLEDTVASYRSDRSPRGQIDSNRRKVVFKVTEKRKVHLHVIMERLCVLLDRARAPTSVVSRTASWRAAPSAVCQGGAEPDCPTTVSLPNLRGRR